ncbi:hypothetical protein [Arcticibacterium luteifluviistationis]|uniref:GTP-binding protein n=1 Tax=Arcticibacterium luteifluviistationis TaxID=1784714 RepID=A0A2Z4G9W1_9BACT|nr:hypothetical protein [Arcticibacterium luteifluviistationis]AWV98001.1 hypothetical protein DJ013_07385 [Arcticibacterium luteifluviistationis]
MTSIRSRPRFKQKNPGSVEEIKNQISSKLKDNTQGIKGGVFSEHFHLEIIKKEQHFWSPHLNVTLEKTDEGTILRGKYGPNPTIWAIFTFSYSSLGIAFLFTAMAGLVKLSLHQESQILWVLPILSLLILGLYIASQTGQKLGVEQTFRIHHFLEETLETRIEIG